jgi:hypothetical protein
MTAPASPEYLALAGACLALCAAHDPFFPKPEPLMTQTWARHIERHRITRADAEAAVYRMYDQNGTGFRPLPKDLTDAARSIRQARDADTGPTPEYEALCESKAADAAELAEIRRQRELAPAADRPQLRNLVAGIAAGKAVES